MENDSWIVPSQLLAHSSTSNKGPDGTCIKVKISGCPSGGLRCTPSSYIRKMDSSKNFGGGGGEGWGDGRVKGRNIKCNQELCNQEGDIIWVKAPQKEFIPISSSFSTIFSSRNFTFDCIFFSKSSNITSKAWKVGLDNLPLQINCIGHLHCHILNEVRSGYQFRSFTLFMYIPHMFWL